MLAGFNKYQGFTLLELLVALAVAAILLSYGVPGFLDVVRNGRAAANANEFVTALSLARSEAVKRGARVTMCASNDGATCSGTWSNGWIVISDNAATDDAAPSIGDVLRVWPAPKGNPAIAISESDGSSTNLTWVRFLPRGGAYVSAAMPITFNMEIENCSDLQARNIEINAVGRTTVARVACP